MFFQMQEKTFQRFMMIIILSKRLEKVNFNNSLNFIKGGYGLVFLAKHKISGI